MTGAEGEGARQLRFPVRFALAGARVDEIEAHPVKNATSRVECAQPLIDVMGTPQEGQRPIFERLQAERHAVDPGGRQIAETRGFHRVRVRFKRDLYVVGKAPMSFRRLDQRGGDMGRHQRRRAAAKEDRTERSPAGFFRLMGKVRKQRRLPRIGIDPVAHMTVKIAVRTLRNTKWPMNI
jgi:hypothetical protein